MELTTKRFLTYLETAKEFSAEHQYLDTPVYTLFQNIEEGTAAKKKNIYKLKRLFFFTYVFYKYYHVKRISNNGIIPTYKGTKILVIIHGSGPQHYGEMILLIKNLVNRGQKVLVVHGTISTEQEEYLKNLNNVFLLRKDDYVYDIGILEFIRNLFKTIAIIKELFRVIENDKELFVLFKSNKGFLLDSFFVSLCHYRFALKIFKSNSIKIVLSSSDGSHYARGFFIHANNLKIENIITQHGFIHQLHTKVIANKVILWLKSDVDYFLQNNFPHGRILQFGLPRFDSIKDERVQDISNLSLLFKIDNNVPKVCFAFPLHAWSYDLIYYRAYLEQIIHISKLLIPKDVKIFIRAHPNDDITDYKNILPDELCSQIMILPTSFPLIQFLKQMDIYITDYSTSLIESMLCNIPTIFFNHEHYWNENTSSSHDKLHDGVFELTDKKELFQVAEKILYDPSYRSELIGKQNLYIKNNILNLGSATQSITDYVLGHCQ